jgi:hypothetical protein
MLAAGATADRVGSRKDAASEPCALAHGWGASPPRGLVEKASTIVDASSRFVARGGQWQPAPELERRILRAALGELKCGRS